MAAPGDGGEIIIKGTSVEVEYNGDVYKPVPGTNKHRSPDKKITKVVVRDERDVVVYDSGDHPGGLKWTITATCM